VYVLKFGLVEYMFKNLDESQVKKFQPKKLIIKSFWAARFEGKNAFWDITTKPKIWIFQKLMHLEASTKAHVHKKIHEFLINMAFTMACPNFKKGLKMAFGPLGVKSTIFPLCLEFLDFWNQLVIWFKFDSKA
jgi:hypothetical protein